MNHFGDIHPASVHAGLVHCVPTECSRSIATTEPRDCCYADAIARQKNFQVSFLSREKALKSLTATCSNSNYCILVEPERWRGSLWRSVKIHYGQTLRGMAAYWWRLMDSSKCQSHTLNGEQYERSKMNDEVAYRSTGEKEI